MKPFPLGFLSNNYSCMLVVVILDACRMCEPLGIFKLLIVIQFRLSCRESVHLSELP